MHPSLKIRGSKSSLLENKKILLCITGSVAAEETVKLARELIRYGADVYAVMSEAAKKIITTDSLQFATGHEVIDKITGDVEHVRFVEDSNLILISPCSANTVSKIAAGIADTTVTLFAVEALGSKNIVIAPAMHAEMYSNPILLKNLKILEDLNVEIVPPKIEENKAKMADIDTILAYTIRALNKTYKNKKVLVIGGGSVEYIDDIRIITNISTGATALELAKNAFYLGAESKLLIAQHSVSLPSFLSIDRFNTVESLISQIPFMLNYDYIFVPAALSDFTVPKTPGKISSDQPPTLKLKQTEKFLIKLREQFKGKIVGFKAEFNVPEKELIKRAKNRLTDENLDYMVANDLKYVTQDETKAYLINKKNILKLEGKKSQVALEILKNVV